MLGTYLMDYLDLKLEYFAGREKLNNKGIHKVFGSLFYWDGRLWVKPVMCQQFKVSYMLIMSTIFLIPTEPLFD